MLLDDRFVGTFGTVAAGDRSSIVKVAVEAARRGFGVVPMQDDAVNPACALGVRDSKKPHDCYHVMTEDTKVRAAFNRLTKDGATCNLAIDVGASNIGWCSDISWWVGPEISPTMLGLEGDAIYVFDLNGHWGNIPSEMVVEGTLLVPPTTDAEAGDYIQLIGQMNLLSDNVRKEEIVNDDRNSMASDTDGIPDTLWNNDTQNLAELSERVDNMARALDDLGDTVGKLQQALVVALTTIKELRDKE